MAVGASDHNDREADFSNRDSYLDLVAPGKDIYSLKLNGGYDTGSGTSAATPFVSGVAGLVLSINPQLTNTQLWWRLYQSADDFPATHYQMAGATPEPVAMPDPAALTFRIYLPSVLRMRTTSGRLNAEQAVRFASTGQFFAPVDTCNGEPTNCAPGCGAEVVLAGSVSGWQDLQALRRFRDEQLVSSAAGQHWIDMYERHRLELAMLLAGDAQLRVQARLALSLWLPLIRTLVDSNSVGSSVIQLEHVQVVKTLVSDISAQGSPEFRRDLQVAASVIALAETYVGQDVHIFWRALMEHGQ